MNESKQTGFPQFGAGIANCAPALRTVAFARLIRCPMGDSGTRNAAASSAGSGG